MAEGGGYLTRGKKQKQEEMEEQRKWEREEEIDKETKTTYVSLERIGKA